MPSEVYWWFHRAFHPLHLAAGVDHGRDQRAPRAVAPLPKGQVRGDIATADRLFPKETDLLDQLGG